MRTALGLGLGVGSGLGLALPLVAVVVLGLPTIAMSAIAGSASAAAAAAPTATVMVTPALNRPTAIAAADDSVLGTFTVKGKTIRFTHVYVTRSSDPAKPDDAWLAVLVSDAALPESARRPAELVALAKSGKVHAVRVVWQEGVDSLTATPFHDALFDSGQPTTGGATIDLRAYDERRLEAKISSRALGQEWHFSATLKANVIAKTSTADDVTEAVPILPPTGIERDTRIEAERPDPIARKRTLGRLGYEYTSDAFQHAVNDGNLDAVTLFLQLGMSPDSASDGHAVLLSAATLCNPDPTGARLGIVNALLAARAAVDPKDENGSTPLLWSINAGCSIEISRALIAAGANVNAKAKGGATPLMMAEALGMTELVKLLKQAGAKD